MKTNQQTRRGFTLVELLVVIVIIASLAGLTAPMVIRQRKKADQTEAVSNARQIGLALFEFENEYGTFPGLSSQAQVTIAFPAPPATVTGGNTDSNAYFRQLFQAEITQSEQMFYAKIPGSVKPDGNIASNTECLKQGECGFGYILNGTEGMSSAGNPSRVIAAAPFATATTFKGDPFDKKAVFLRIDNSATSLTIKVAATSTDNSGPVNVGGANILLAASGIWGSTTPTVSLADLP